MHCMLKSCCRRVVPKLVVGCSNEAEEENQTGEHEDEWHVCSQRATHEDETHQRHDDVVISLTGEISLCKSTGTVRTIGIHDAVERVREVAKNEPVASIGDESHHGECVAENELCKASDIHCDSAHEVV